MLNRGSGHRSLVYTGMFMVGIVCSCWSGMSDGLFWLNKEQRENEGSSRGFFELEKECIVLPVCPVALGWIGIAQCTNQHGGVFWIPVAPGPVPFFGEYDIIPLPFFFRSSFNEWNESGGWVDNDDWMDVLLILLQWIPRVSCVRWVALGGGKRGWRVVVELTFYNMRLWIGWLENNYLGASAFCGSSPEVESRNTIVENWLSSRFVPWKSDRI